MSKKAVVRKRKIVWRVRVMMAERGVRSVSQLARLLSDSGVEISTVQLGRMIDGNTQYIKKEVIEGLMNVLDCDLGDLVGSN